MKTVEVSESALESLKAMVEQLQSDRDELLDACKALVDWYGLRNIESDELRDAIYQPNEIAFAMEIIAKCTQTQSICDWQEKMNG